MNIKYKNTTKPIFWWWVPQKSENEYWKHHFFLLTKHAHTFSNINHGFQTRTGPPGPTKLTVNRLKDPFFKHQELDITPKSVNHSNYGWTVQFLENWTGFKHGSSQGQYLKKYVPLFSLNQTSPYLLHYWPWFSIPNRTSSIGITVNWLKDRFFKHH